MMCSSTSVDTSIVSSGGGNNDDSTTAANKKSCELCDSVVNSLSSELWSRLWRAGLLSVLYFLAAPSAQAAESQQPGTHEPSEEELVKQTQNPVADLISVPFQNNFNFEVGPKHNHQIYLLNIQPVIPIHITENWNLISRIIQPVIKPAVARSRHRERHGAWRHEPDLLFISGKAWRADLGCGSDVYVADGHRQATGKRQIQSRPGGSRVMMTEHWVFGTLFNNQWSVAGWGSGHVNQMLIQPFVNYNLPDHWYLISAPIMTTNWAAKGSDVWTVPLGGGIGKLFRLGEILPLQGHEIAKRPINTQIQAFGNVARPDDGAKWQLRFQFQFLFPK